VTLPDNADVVDLLVHQHHEVKRALAEVGALEGDSKAAAFARLQRLLTAHESAEQQVVHPATRDLAHNADVARARVEEEMSTDDALAELHALGAAHPDFDARFALLRDAVLAHNEREENEEFLLLRNTQSRERLVEMADSLREVQSMR